MSRPLLNQPIHWVDSDSRLHSLCQTWHTKKLLAVDTEFMRSQTYYPIAGLLQVNDGDANYLIDPTVVSDLSPFAQVLLDPHVIKVLHSCSEDLEVFQRSLNVIPVNLLDTQVGAALCGYGFSVGYANLVRVVLDRDLPKEETRSDWLQRPLSQAQTEYAAVDVEYLYQLASILMLKLKNRGRLEWLKEDCERQLEAYAGSQDEQQVYLKVKQAWRLNARQLGVLKALAAWRERRARERDVPRNRVIKEHSLMDIAMMSPQHISQLRQFEGITERMIRTDGSDLIEVVQSVEDLDACQLPAVLPRPLSSSENKYTRRLREPVLALAESMELAPEILLKKRDYEMLTRVFIRRENDDLEEIKRVLGQSLEGWRYQLLADPLAEAIGAQSAESSQPVSPES